MAEKLRTLKEIIPEEKFYNGRETFLPIEIYNELRQEAIKYIKDCEKQFPNINKKVFEFPEDVETVCARAVRSWIKIFFNINNEDLTEQKIFEMYDEKIAKMLLCEHTVFNPCKCKYHPPRNATEKCSCPLG